MMKKNYLFTLMLLATFGFSNLTAQCITAADTYNNLITAGGAPCFDGTSCAVTDGGFSGFGIWGSEAYQLDGVEAGFDYVFDMCSGFGAGAWVPEITILSPSGNVDATNFGDSGSATHAANCSLEWTASESGTYLIIINELGTFNGNALSQVDCNTTLTTDNGNPTVTCGTNPFVCIPFDVAIDSVYLSEYTAVPLDHSGSYTPAAGVTNLATNAATNITVDVTIFNGANAPVFTTSMTQANLAAGTSTDLVSATSFTPSSVDFYLAEFIVSITEADGVAANDTFRTAIDVTDSLYARDFAYLIGAQNGVTATIGVNGTGNTAILGNVFDVTTASELVNIQAFINATVAPGDTVNARLYNFAANTVGTEIAMQERIFTTTDTPVVFIEFTFNEPLAPGQYFMAIEETNSINSIGLWASDDIYTPNRSKGNINGGAFEDLADLGVRNVPLIRANLFTPTPIQDCEELIISEVIEGSGNNKCIELYNPTTSNIDLNTYEISIYSNGSSSVNSTQTLSGSIPAQGTFVICNSGATSDFTNLADVTNLNASTSFNGNDVIELSKNGQVIDIVGEIGSSSDFNDNQTLIRKETVLKGDVDGSDAFDASVWTSLPQNDFSNLGVHFSDCNPVCRIDSIVAGTQTACVNTNNEYTQELSIYFNNPPATGSIDVNGEIFAFTTSPLTITLTGLDSDGNDVDVTAFFTDDNACTFTETAAFTAPATCLCPTINVTVNTTDVVNCVNPDGTITTTVSGGTAPYSYAWTPVLADTANFDDLNAGTYDVVVTDDEGCTGSGSGTISNTAGGVSATLDNSADISCNGANDGEINVTTNGGTAPFDYSWTNSTETTEDLSNLGPNTYTLTVTDANLCTFTLAAVTIAEPDPISITLDNSTDITCNGASDGEIEMTVTGGTGTYDYSWTNSTETTEDLSNLGPNTYTLTVTDVNLCTESSSAITINEPSALLVSLDGSSDVTCNGANDGEIEMTVTGGTGTYDYSWTNSSETTEDLSNLGPNTYTLTVTDANLCTESSSAITINEPTALIVTLDSTSNVTCNGASDGEIYVSTSGGASPYTYSWTNSTEITEDLSGLSANDYTLTVTDANLCSVALPTVTISEPDVLSATTISTDESTSGAADGSVGVTVSGGTTPYFYVWTTLPSETGNAVQNLSQGNYEVTVTDSNGCVLTETITVDLANGISSLVNESLQIYPNPAVKDISIAFEVIADEEITISLINTIGKVVFSEAIQVNGSTTKTIDISNFAAGIYMLELNNSEGKVVKMITIAK